MFTQWRRPDGPGACGTGLRHSTSVPEMLASLSVYRSSDCGRPRCARRPLRVPCLGTPWRSGAIPRRSAAPTAVGDCRRGSKGDRAARRRTRSPGRPATAGGGSPCRSPPPIRRGSATSRHTIRSPAGSSPLRLDANAAQIPLGQGQSRLLAGPLRAATGTGRDGPPACTGASPGLASTRSPPCVRYYIL